MKGIISRVEKSSKKIFSCIVEFVTARVFTKKNFRRLGKFTYQSLRISAWLLLCFILFSHDQKINEIQADSSGSLVFPYESFGKVVIDVEIDSSFTSESFEFSSSGSSIVVDTSEGVSTILTAEHVCNPPPIKRWAAIAPQGSINKEITIEDFYGNKHEAEIVLTDPGYDLCLLRVAAVWAPGVPLADSPVSIGEKVYNVAAPGGFFQPGMVPLLEGRYSGDMGWIADNDSVYTIPVRGGSSGSGVFNSRGELIGVIHSAIYDFPNVGLACTYEELNDFMLTYYTLFPN